MTRYGSILLLGVALLAQATAILFGLFWSAEFYQDAWWFEPLTLVGGVACLVGFCGGGVIAVISLVNLLTDTVSRPPE